VAYRFDGGMRVVTILDPSGDPYGTCEYPEAIPIDFAPVAGTPAAPYLLTQDVEETALTLHRNVPMECTVASSAVVVTEDGNSIASAGVAVDENGVVAVVWSSEDPSTGEWRIMGRILDPATCD
jgi:hypothetical protein